MSLTKREIRLQIQKLKEGFSESQKSKEAKVVFDIIESLQAFKNSSHILLYHSLSDELPTHDIIDFWSQTKHIYLPKVVGHDLHIVKYDGNLTRGEYNILEPMGNEVDGAIIELAIVPGIAFDIHCNRIGRGKGFYDRFICATPNVFTLGVGFDCQYINEVPYDKHDQALCGVITPSHISFRKSYR